VIASVIHARPAVSYSPPDCAGSSGDGVLRHARASRDYSAGHDAQAARQADRGSLGILIPRDFAEAMDVTDGNEVRLTLVGRQVVIEPVRDTLDDDSVGRAFGAVRRRHSSPFEHLAA
jgi:hypothetical protein